MIGGFPRRPVHSGVAMIMGFSCGCNRRDPPEPTHARRHFQLFPLSSLHAGPVARAGDLWNWNKHALDLQQWVIMRASRWKNRPTLLARIGQATGDRHLSGEEDRGGAGALCAAGSFLMGAADRTAAGAGLPESPRGRPTSQVEPDKRAAAKNPARAPTSPAARGGELFVRTSASASSTCPLRLGQARRRRSDLQNLGAPICAAGRTSRGIPADRARPPEERDAGRGRAGSGRRLHQIVRQGAS